MTSEPAVTVATEGLSDVEVSVLQALLFQYRIVVGKRGRKADVTIGRDVQSASTLAIQIPRTHVRENADSDNGIITLPYDILDEPVERMKSVLNPRVSVEYRVITRFPFQYNMIPSSIRSLFLRARREQLCTNTELHSEISKMVLIEAIKKLGLNVERKNGPVFQLTHDIDSARGLQRSLILKNVDDEMGIQSTWFVVSNEYSIPRAFARDLAQDSIIGSHDTRHDGRLIGIDDRVKLVSRLRTSKSKLERIFEQDITSFRAPLMQFGEKIISALSSSGYSQDFSLPCWEPVHPSTMGGFGAQIAHRFEFSGLSETPLTLFQDHQLLHVMKLSTRRAVDFWLSQAKLVRSLDGDISLLVHPDYLFAEDTAEYKRLLTELTQIQVECGIESHAELVNSLAGARDPKGDV